MIGRIQGKILEKIPPHILVDCNGVGYEIEVPMTTFYDLPEVGSVTVYAAMANDIALPSLLSTFLFGSPLAELHVCSINS